MSIIYKCNDLLRLVLENCKVCADKNCTGESVDIIKNACLDDVELASFVSMPLSTLSTTNDYIETIDSEFSFQLVEMALFKFPSSDESEYAIHTYKAYLMFKRTFQG